MDPDSLRRKGLASDPHLLRTVFFSSSQLKLVMHMYNGTNELIGWALITRPKREGSQVSDCITLPKMMSKVVVDELFAWSAIQLSTNWLEGVDSLPVRICMSSVWCQFRRPASVAQDQLANPGGN